jgi:hypothetical protein
MEAFYPDAIGEMLHLGPAYGVQSPALVPTARLRASSARLKNWAEFGPQHARLLGETAWEPATNSSAKEWVQVDFGAPREVGAVATQGSPTGRGWISAFEVLVSTDGTHWTNADSGSEDHTFSGNMDSNAIAVSVFATPAVARYLRIVPLASSGWPALRFEAYHPYRSRFQVLGIEGLGVPMGLQDGFVPNANLTASSAFDTGSGHLCAPENGRLRTATGAGAWCSATLNTTKEWFQIETDGSFEIGGIALQGRTTTLASPKPTSQWVTSFRVSYSNDGVRFAPLTVPDTVFLGNFDANTVRRVPFPAPLVRARFLRIHPVSYSGHISMRVEVFDSAARNFALRASHRATLSRNLAQLEGVALPRALEEANGTSSTKVDQARTSIMAIKEELSLDDSLADRIDRVERELESVLRQIGEEKTRQAKARREAYETDSEYAARKERYRALERTIKVNNFNLEEILHKAKVKTPVIPAKFTEY